jgi:hypothetical protein
VHAVKIRTFGFGSSLAGCMLRPRVKRVWRLALLAAGLAALALLTCAGTALAQAVAGRLVSTNGGPVPWALVRLVDDAGNSFSGSVTTERGTFRLSAPGPGTYRVRAERIGFRMTLSEPLELVEAETFPLTLIASDAAITLEKLEVSSRKSCGLDEEEGSDLFAIWTEVEKALELQIATDESGLYSYRAEVYDNVRVDLEGRPTNPSNAETRTYETTIYGSSGFFAFDPEVLVERGFRWGAHHFFAPDARTLLSEPFQSTHCYRPRRKGDRLGLAFEPEHETGDRVDVKGTLWLDASDGKLRTSWNSSSCRRARGGFAAGGYESRTEIAACPTTTAREVAESWPYCAGRPTGRRRRSGSRRWPG